MPVNRWIRRLSALGLGLALTPSVPADEPSKDGSKPVPVPVTRRDMKQALENSKRNTPRLPLPELTPEQKARAEESAKARTTGAAPADGRSGLGGGIVNNGRMRGYYLSEYGQGGFGGRPAGAAAGGGERGQNRTPGGDRGQARGNGSPDYAFQTMLFWIVSRGNNCTYCMGHQESKLASAGLSDDQIAALDSRWSVFTPAQQAAFAFAKKLTYEPHAVSDADIAALRAFYDDAQITEMLVAIGGFNAMNRWTGALRIPQEDHREYLTPTSESFEEAASQVAPVAAEAVAGLVAPVPRQRPALESRAEVEAALAAARTRTPRLKLADESATRSAVGEAVGDHPAQWMRLLAAVPNAGPGRVNSHLAAEQKGKLDPRFKAIVAWVSARNDRAWYALDQARRRLKGLGLTDDQIFAFDAPETLASPADGEVARFARILAVDPAQVTDADFDRLKKHFDDRTIAEIVHQATEAAFFDRLTETAALPLEPEAAQP